MESETMAENENINNSALSANVCDGSLAICGNTLDRNDPFVTEGNGTAKFIGGGGKFDFHTIKAANILPTKRSIRMEMSKNELIHMLCCLEGELQARDVVVATLRNERVKHLINTIRHRNVALDDPSAALFRDQIASAGNLVSRQSSTAAIQADLEVRAIIDQQMENLCHVASKQRHTQVRMVKVLADSLENNQRMRQELEEEKRKHEHDTAQGDDITYGLEMERTKLKQELETERNGRKKLEKDLKKVQDMLDFERGRQKQIVLLLLAERKKIITKYIEERKRSEDLGQILSEEKQRIDALAEGLEEESKKSLRMEAELEKQTLAVENERKAMKINLAKEEKRIKDLETELLELRKENEAFRKQAVALRVQPQHNVLVLPIKVRPGADEVNPVAPTSMMNVAKVVQPTATVSSVPVSGPTTGIARSISPGQSLRQQATIPNENPSAIGVSSSTFNAPPAKVTPRKFSNPTMVANIAAVVQSSTTSQAVTSDPNASIVVAAASIVGAVNPSAIGKLQCQAVSSVSNQAIIGQSTILRASSSAAAAASAASTAAATTAIGVATSVSTTVSAAVGNAAAATVAGVVVPPSTAITAGGLASSTGVNSGTIPTAIGSLIHSGTIPAGGGRGMPPPIPPNKPIVPPKREPSVSRLGSISAASSNKTPSS